jgi:superfamily II DNA or RNA helicase
MGSSESELLAPGTIVRIKSDPGRQGVITGRNRMQGDVRKYQVSFPEDRTFLPEYELEIITDDDSDWESLIKSGRFGRVRDLRRNLTHIHLNGRLANLVYSMDATNTDFYAYQYKPVLSFLDSPSNGLLIADEVGLGKTIEAGLIWTELRARYDARRLLVVCPAMLREKWCSELHYRFGVDAEIMDAADMLNTLQQNKHHIPDGKGIVCSLQGLRPPSDWDDDENNTSPRAKLAKYLDDQATDDPLIDLVIIDEAHYLRNPASQSAKLGHLLRGVTDNIVLLSATPINLSDDDLFHLLNLVDPDSFAVKEVFPHVLGANEHLQRARDLTLDIRSSSDDIHDELKQAQDHFLLKNSRQLAQLVSTNIAEEFLNSEAERVQLANQIERINLLRHAVTRTRKSEVTEWRVVREPVKCFVELDESSPEWLFYQAVTDAIRRYAIEADINDGFLLAGPQRQVSSCMYAAAQAWIHKIEKYDEQLYEDFGIDSNGKYDLSPLIQRLRSEVLPNIDLKVLRAHDSKYEKFRETILGYLKENPSEKVIVFSFYRKTLSYLSERLGEDGVQSQVLVGGMRETKQEIIDKFKEHSEIRVLLSSEVASEGVDLQFSRVLVNYDLPWNPMKIEQRIGRIDRIGQSAEKISIINFLFTNTIDHKIHEKLYDRLRIFERALGGMEAILGEEISELTSALLSKPLNEEQEQKRIEQTAIAIERIRHDHDELEKQASHLIAHGGYILDEVQAAHQFKKRITDLDLVAYVKDYFEKYCQGFEFHQFSTDELRFQIRLSAVTAASLDDFIKKNKLYGQTRLATGENTKCQFSNKVVDPKQKDETISQFHPLIRFISNQLHAKGEAYYSLVAVKLKLGLRDSIPPGKYAFFVHRWVFSGMKIEEDLPVRVVEITSGNKLSPDESWKLLNIARVEGSDWLEIDLTMDKEKLVNALDSCGEMLDKDYKKTLTQRKNENSDRVNFQIESAERHRNRQLKTCYDTLNKYHTSGKTRMIPATKGKIKKIKERFEVQKEKLKQKAELSSSPSDVCCGAILVE